MRQINLFVEPHIVDHIKDLQKDDHLFEIKSLNLPRLNIDKLDLSSGNLFIIDMGDSIEKKRDYIEKLKHIPFKSIVFITENKKNDLSLIKMNSFFSSKNKEDLSYNFDTALSFLDYQLNVFEDFKNIYSKNYYYAFYTYENKKFIFENGLFDFLSLDLKSNSPSDSYLWGQILQKFSINQKVIDNKDESSFKSTLGDGRVIEFGKVKIQNIYAIIIKKLSFDNILPATPKEYVGLFEQSPELSLSGQWGVDFEADTLYWTEDCYSIMEFPVNSSPPGYEEFYDYIHPDDRQKVRVAVEMAAQQVRPLDIEYRVYSKKNNLRYVRLQGKVFFDESGNPVKMVGTVRDITKEKKYEKILLEKHHLLGKEVQKTQESLREKEKRLSLLFDSMQEGVVTLNKEGLIREVNSSFLKMFHYKERDQLIDLFIDEVLYESSFLEIKKWIDLIENEKREHEFELKLKDGKSFFIGMTVTDQILGGEIYYTLVLRDITYQKEYEVKLEAAKNQAEFASNAKTNFLSRMSHELRTPLNVILGFTQFLERDDQINNEQKSHIKEIKVAGKSLLSMINEVLELSKIEKGQVLINNSALNPYLVVNECINQIKPLIESKNLELINDFKENNETYVFGDSIKLKQIFLNLLSNACKYTNNDGKIKIQIVEHTKNVYFAIHDTGVGIDDKHMSQLFEPFNRLGHENSNIEGTGIGLLITKEYLSQLGSNIDVQSSLDKGSVFTFKLPYAAEEDLIDIKDQNLINYEYFKDSDIKNILYIEDNPSNIYMLENFLNKFDNVTLLTAQTAHEGLELINGFEFDLVIVDLNLPDMTGKEVAQKIVSNTKNKNLKLISLTADLFSTKSDIFDHHFLKPIDFEEFYGVLKDI